MIITSNIDVNESFLEARTAARKRECSVLLSEVTRIGALDPLSFYHSGKEKYTGTRFFWQDPASSTILAGIGNIDTIQTDDNTKRYQAIEQVWNDLLDRAIVAREKEIRGTGPLLFGGFSFDHQKSGSELWDQFGDNLFYIPKYLLSVIDGEAYLTLNLLIKQDDSLTILTDAREELEELAAKARKEAAHPAYSNELIEQEEIFPEEWKGTVQAAIEEIKATDLDKIVLARETRLAFRSRVDAEPVLAGLLLEQQTSYIFCLESGSDYFIGASPEQLVKKQGGVLSSACLAGSIARGMTQEEDERLGNSLLQDEKNQIEHQYVVSMIKDSMQSVCETVEVPSGPVLMKTRHIQHLFTPVEGECKDGVSIFDCVEKLHPTPAMGGLPKKKAVERIRVLERLERGFYAAPVGWTDGKSNGEFAAAIRSALVQGNEASLFAGCGIVESSIPESEYIETAIKFKPMLSALGGKLHATP
ncbi:isochorismate synthase MenF [Peribacillus sp. SCS-37]|uniref:isochorismate synthase n=1 Tax=Paraperibacillus esterisolvens TaxID=3115296 RepID=UPI0039069C0A